MEKRKYYYETGYENGAAVRKLRPEWENQETPRPRVIEQPQPQQQPKIGIGAELISILLLVTAIAMTLYMCINYLQVQSDIVQLDKQIAALEKNITLISKENDAVEAVLENEINDLDYIYQMAVGVLGMVYPNQNEVIYYENSETGYFRQYQDIPEK